jgi:glycosyltransferase involved in cell wall biosynthesis
MRVVHVVSGDLWAGSAVATFHLLCGLARAGAVEARAVVLNPGELAERLAARGLLAAVEPEAGRGFAALARAVRARVAGADLVHAHGYKEGVLAALSRRPWIATQHGRPEPWRGAARARMAGYAALERALQRVSARRVVAVSGEIERWLAGRLGAARVSLAWNGIEDPVAAGQVPPAWGARPRRVGVLARLAPVKGVDLALRAVARCADVELEIVGDGPERPRLAALAAAGGAGGRIRFAGFDPQPGARLARWRALLVPSLHEGNPIAVLEALAWGTPVVAGPLPGVAEILGGRGGVCLADRDEARWAEAIARIVGDEAGGAALAAAGRARFLEAFTADAAAAPMLAIYRDVLGGRR